MNSARTKRRLTWAIIFAQVFIFVIGHGRVVLCHEASGSSHIELVDRESCSTDIRDGCNEIASNQSGVPSEDYSGSSCVDELFQIVAALSNKRKVDAELGQGSQPLFTMAFASWLRLPDPVIITVTLTEFDEAQLLTEQLRSIRTAVLVL